MNYMNCNDLAKFLGNFFFLFCCSNVSLAWIENNLTNIFLFEARMENKFVLSIIYWLDGTNEKTENNMDGIETSNCNQHQNEITTSLIVFPIY